MCVCVCVCEARSFYSLAICEAVLPKRWRWISNIWLHCIGNVGDASIWSRGALSVVDSEVEIVWDWQETTTFCAVWAENTVIFPSVLYAVVLYSSFVATKYILLKLN